MSKKNYNNFFSWLWYKKKKNNNKPEENQKQNKQEETTKDGIKISKNTIIIKKRNKITENEIKNKNIQNLNNNNQKQSIQLTQPSNKTLDNQKQKLSTTSLNNNIYKSIKNKKNEHRYNNVFQSLQFSLKKTKNYLEKKIKKIFFSNQENNHLFESIEEMLLLSDFGVNTTANIIKSLKKEIHKNNTADKSEIFLILKKILLNILNKSSEKKTKINQKKPKIILIVGVNGVGKTTTIGKLAYKLKKSGNSIMLAAGDTFRAAAVDQLQIFGKKNKVPVIYNRIGTDPSAVIYDSIQAAKAKKIDVLIADTAGRLHNKQHLMEELKKIIRIIKKYNLSSSPEITLVIDACSGQNTLQQVKLFNNTINVNNIIVTKLDGTAKGGIIFAISDQFSIPINYLGFGEKIYDLQEFNKQKFIEFLFEKNKN
ncbi:signal recognition particle-docking protein FtsY [Buchnera aphidicola]|uniref:Signal recognition particle receptor FtsY n=1 Tax=Buchnera aphidicola (Anoecia oenotherae) TaxID=1241833 RepID=A0A4D6XR12_9GAMM|nr:signal recognition particle-docking protein FtsY [Buchnera aphidicola]QCI19166.1 signal recognition particle-docking protein FtsY [Buchnera aphidicola (Anoecia oenotherae)]